MQSSKPRPIPSRFILIFLLLATLVATIAAIYFYNLAQQTTIQVCECVTADDCAALRGKP